MKLETKLIERVLMFPPPPSLSNGPTAPSSVPTSFPGRVGFVAIDGIVDPGSRAIPQVGSQLACLREKDVSILPRELFPCARMRTAVYAENLIFLLEAGPGACALAGYTNGPHGNIEARIESFLNRLARAPSSVPFGYRPGYETSGAARALMLKALEVPMQWAVFSRAFADALAGNGMLLFNKLAPVPPPPYPTDHARLAVMCLESSPLASPAEVPTAEDLAAEFLRTMREVSPHFERASRRGSPTAGASTGPPVERESPMAYAHCENTLNSLMPNSTRIIIQDSPGHCSLSVPAPCALKLVRDYFAGILPESGRTCETAYDYFLDPSVSLSAFGAEDRKLLQSARAVADLLRHVR
ncbi:hypothetical protein FB451DRAFT_1170546 [Mycena latifolia]|nr:hypothetical protein FB451DRAFT_1170546 [Mycena latifolia]